MDRLLSAYTERTRRVPRASGDGPSGPVLPDREPPCSPRERGWTAVALTVATSQAVFPARAGMDRRPPGRRCMAYGVPRASGDGPCKKKIAERVRACSPRERGWTRPHLRRAMAEGVFPARAGMDLTGGWRSTTLHSVPRASGDGPGWVCPLCGHAQCSPRERGWTRNRAGAGGDSAVFPARAGMDPATGLVSSCRCRVPRASGDGPTGTPTVWVEALCSPRERGWTRAARLGRGG